MHRLNTQEMCKFHGILSFMGKAGEYVVCSDVLTISLSNRFISDSKNSKKSRTWINGMLTLL